MLRMLEDVSWVLGRMQKKYVRRQVELEENGEVEVLEILIKLEKRYGGD